MRRCTLRTPKYFEQCDDGFTLIEMLVALAILGGAMAALLASFSMAAQLVARTTNSMGARALADNLMEQAKSFGARVSDLQGQTDQFSWAVRIVPSTGIGSGKLRSGTLSVQVRERGSLKPYSLSGLILLPGDKQQ